MPRYFLHKIVFLNCYALFVLGGLAKNLARFPRPIRSKTVTWAHAFFRAWLWLDVFTLNCDRFIKFSYVIVIGERNWDGKLLRHVAMVAEFLDDIKPKKPLKKCSHCFKLHWSYWVSLNFQMLANVFGVESERTVCSIRIGKRKRTFLSCVPLLHKEGAWNYKVSRGSHVH